LPKKFAQKSLYNRAFRANVLLACRKLSTFVYNSQLASFAPNLKHGIWLHAGLPSPFGAVIIPFGAVIIKEFVSRLTIGVPAKTKRVSPSKRGREKREERKRRF
jgi:hypothetical protein